MTRISKGAIRRAEKQAALDAKAEKFRQGKKGGAYVRPYDPPRYEGKLYPYASTKRLGTAAP